MFVENLPSFKKLENEGLFMGYSQYDPVYKYENKMYICYSYLSKSKGLIWFVHRFYSEKGKRLVKAYSPMEDGSPLEKGRKYTNVTDNDLDKAQP